MSEDQSRKRLGRGLAALIGEIERPMPEKPAAPDGRVAVSAITPNKRNPRRSFGEADLADLAQSIRAHGLVQPIVVRPAAGEAGRFEIIAGERRWRAAQAAGLADVPVIVRPVSDRMSLELAIVENVQRADLNAIEEAAGYQQLIDEHGYTQADLGQVVGKSRSHVANTLRLLKLPETVRAMVTEGALSAGHARTLVTAGDPEALAKRIVAEGLSVRQAEALAQAPADPEPPKPSLAKEADMLALEKLLSDAMGLRVAISRKQRGGELKIAYRTPDQLDDICRRLKG